MNGVVTSCLTSGVYDIFSCFWYLVSKLQSAEVQFTTSLTINNHQGELNMYCIYKHFFVIILIPDIYGGISVGIFCLLSSAKTEKVSITLFRSVSCGLKVR